MRHALHIEDLLRWVYQIQAADHVSRVGAGRLVPAGYGSNGAAVLRHGMLGGRVDCASSVVIAADLHPDAELVHNAVCGLPTRQTAVVIQHARAGTVPDWMPGATPRLVSLTRGRKPKMEYWDSARTRPAYCLLTWDPDPDTIVFARWMYAEWRDALEELAVSLQGLTAHVVSGVAAPARPWE